MMLMFKGYYNENDNIVQLFMKLSLFLNVYDSMNFTIVIKYGGVNMKKFGIIFLLVAFLFWTIIPTFGIISGKFFNENSFIVAIAFAIVGCLLILVDVSRDRYKEYKEDEKNNDYRKY